MTIAKKDRYPAPQTLCQIVAGAFIRSVHGDQYRCHLAGECNVANCRTELVQIVFVFTLRVRRRSMKKEPQAVKQVLVPSGTLHLVSHARLRSNRPPKWIVWTDDKQ